MFSACTNLLFLQFCRCSQQIDFAHSIGFLLLTLFLVFCLVNDDDPLFVQVYHVLAFNRWMNLLLFLAPSFSALIFMLSVYTDFNSSSP